MILGCWTIVSVSVWIDCEYLSICGESDSDTFINVSWESIMDFFFSVVTWIYIYSLKKTLNTLKTSFAENMSHV